MSGQSRGPLDRLHCLLYKQYVEVEISRSSRVVVVYSRVPLALPLIVSVVERLVGGELGALAVELHVARVVARAAHARA